jgi:hypothetical protein
VKRSLRIIAVSLSIFVVLTATDTASAGPFRDFFKTLRRTFTQPPEKPKSRTTSRKKSNDTPPSDRASSKGVAGPPSEENVRVGKVATTPKEARVGLPYGTPVAGKQGFVTSPFAPERGYVDVRGFAPGTPVKDPYSDKIFLTP